MAHRLHFHKQLPPNPKKDSAGCVKQAPPAEHPPVHNEFKIGRSHQANEGVVGIASLKRLLVTLWRERQLFRASFLMTALSTAGCEYKNFFTHRDYLARRMASRIGFAVWSGRTISAYADDCPGENQGRTSPEHKGGALG